MNKVKRIFLMLLLCSVYLSAQVTDIIKTVNLTAGKTDSVLISDMFFSPEYEIKIPNDNLFPMKYNAEKGYLYFYPPADKEGYFLLSVYSGNEKLSFPVFVKQAITHTFTFIPRKKYAEISIFGEFNGWNRHKDYLTDENDDGIYEVTLEMDPGKYQYKFYADGIEIVDPSNPDSVNNGMGGYNSVIVIPERQKDYSFLHAVTYKERIESVDFFYYYERKNPPRKPSAAEVVALLDNSLIKPEKIDINGYEIKISLPKSMLEGRHYLRTAINFNGNSTNMQFVPVEGGKPVNNDSQFSWYDGVIYSLMIDRFANGDKSNDKPIEHDSLFQKANYYGGDFAGLKEKIEEGYFDSLGINVLWISPVYDNPNKAFREWPEPHRWFSGYHGYWPISSTRVEEHFGSFNDLKELIALAHEHGIKVLLDFVSNHVHKDHPFFNEHRDWFGKLELPDGRLNLRMWDEYRLTTWFEPYLPSFDYVHSSEAVDTMTANAIWWLKESGADGFRHDAVKHVPFLFWRELTRKLKTAFPGKEIYQIGETFGNYELVSSYVNNGQLNAQFNFNLYDIAQAAFIDSNVSFSELAKELKKTANIYGPIHLMGNIMDSHDKNRFIAYADGDLQLWQWNAVEEGWNDPPKVDNPSSYDKAELYYAYMFGIPGIPVVYYGSEFGMSGASDPDNRRPMRFGDQLNDHERKMLKDVSRLIKLRRNHTALRYGDFKVLHADKNTFAFVRSDMHERILIVINNSPNPQRVDLTFPAVYNINFLEDLLTGDSIYPERDFASVTVKGFGYRYLRIVK